MPRLSHISIVLFSAAILWPTAVLAEADKQTGRHYFEVYERGEMPRLFEAGTDRFRADYCGGQASGCPRIQAVEAHGALEGESFSCGAERCSYTATRVYETRPDFPGMQSKRWAWTVTMDRHGRYEGVTVQDSDASQRLTADAVLAIGVLLLWSVPGGLVIFAVLFSALRFGTRERTLVPDAAEQPDAK